MNAGGRKWNLGDFSCRLQPVSVTALVRFFCFQFSINTPNKVQVNVCCWSCIHLRLLRGHLDVQTQDSYKITGTTLDIILSVLAKYSLSVLMPLIVTDAGATGTFTYIQNDVGAWPVLLGRVQTFDQRAVPGRALVTMCDFICPAC